MVATGSNSLKWTAVTLQHQCRGNKNCLFTGTFCDAYRCLRGCLADLDLPRSDFFLLNLMTRKRMCDVAFQHCVVLTRFLSLGISHLVTLRLFCRGLVLFYLNIACTCLYKENDNLVFLSAVFPKVGPFFKWILEKNKDYLEHYDIYIVYIKQRTVKLKVEMILSIKQDLTQVKILYWSKISVGNQNIKILGIRSQKINRRGILSSALFAKFVFSVWLILTWNCVLYRNDFLATYEGITIISNWLQKLDCYLRVV